MIKIVMTNKDNFLRIAETLTRMGIANNKDKVLYQSCHILQKQGEYFIAHFKDMMKLDGKRVQIAEEDQIRTYSIAKTLESWGLLTVVDDQKQYEVTNNFRVIKFSQKPEWTLTSKYTVGK